MAVQLTTTSTVTDQINQLAKTARPTDFEVRRVKREIERLKAADIAQHYMLLGMLYSVLGDEKECRENHERSLKLSSEIIFLENYAFSLKRLGASADALRLLLRAFDMAPVEEVFEEAAQAMIFAGDLTQYEQILDRFAKANPERSLDKVHAARYIRNVKSYLDRADVSSDDFRAAMQLIESVMLAMKCRGSVEAINFHGGTFDGVPHVNVDILINADSGLGLNFVNDAIADAMASADDIEAWNRLVFTVSEWTVDKEEVA
ncbi:tetratricopeptide repeat protein [Pseudomonas sp. TAE6080]|uniref:tetratricopeptide repeat protein n=1 Tax=Pseudomonas sp. TAE6080 TaxID=2840374 RepID=UPI001C00519C|nr:tetratricopeptide repeat protein [Pseudomonas sp. TAE6080]MBT9299766.1 tetratricopeptide repeat protein [Pseudomonas sp. TAE6080]